MSDELTLADKVREGEPLTDTEKIDYVFGVVKRLEHEILPKLEALTSPSGPLGSVLGMFGLGR